MRVSRASEVSGPIGAIIDVDRRRADDGPVVISLSGDVDRFSVPRLRAALDDAVGRSDVVLDLRGVDFCDSSTLRVFVDAQRASAASGHTLDLTHPSPAVRALFDVSGLRGVLRITA